jgi:hypothetical protein
MIFCLGSFRKNCRPLPGVNIYIYFKMILIIIFKCNGIHVFRKICKPGCGILAADETPLAMEDRFKGTVKTNIK